MADDEPDSAPPRSDASAPRRPGFISGLPQRDEVPRPRTIVVARIAVLLALVAFVVPTVLAALDRAAIRAELRLELVARAPDYSIDDIDRALTITLIAGAAIGALLCLLELSAASSLRKRSTAGRTALVVLVVLHLPVLVVTHAFRDVPHDLAFSVAQAALLLVAAGAALAPQTRRWLRAKPPLAVTTLLRQQDEAPRRTS